MTQIKKVCHNQKLALESTPIKKSEIRNTVEDEASYPANITKNVEGNALCSYHTRIQIRKIKQLRKTHRSIIKERKDNYKDLLSHKYSINKQAVLKNAFIEEGIY